MVTNKPLRVLAFDISLSSPGAAVVSVDKNGQATIEAVTHTKTNAKDNYAIRGAQIEHWAHLFARANLRKGYDTIVRENYSGKFGNHPIFSAWAGIDRGLHYLALEITEKSIPQQTVKKLVVGKGVATKEEVEAAVRKLTGFAGDFLCDDESDAAAIALAYLIREGYVTGPPQAPKTTRKKAVK